QLDETRWTEQEILHMQDVAILYEKGRFLLAILILFLIGMSVYLNKKELLSAFFKSARLGFLISLVGGISVFLLSFTDVFVLFHEVAFSNDLWFFPHPVWLTTLFDDAFFVAITFRIWITATVFFFLLYVLTKLVRKA
ncbi:MAG: putative membrane protein, partial [Candidatus Woesearchaeota archaeon]